MRLAENTGIEWKCMIWRGLLRSVCLELKRLGYRPLRDIASGVESPKYMVAKRRVEAFHREMLSVEGVVSSEG